MKIKALSSAFLMLGSSLAFGSAVSESESNGTFATAQIIPVSSFTTGADPDLEDDSLPSVSISGAITTDNDVDFYCFGGTAGDSLYLDIDYGEDQGLDLDTYLHLFDNNQVLLAHNDDTSSSPGA